MERVNRLTGPIGQPCASEQVEPVLPSKEPASEYFVQQPVENGSAYFREVWQG